MPLPTTKLCLAYEKLAQELGSIKEEDNRNILKDDLSPCNIIAYQIGWGRLLLGWEKSEKAGKMPDMPAKGYKWNEIGKLASSFYMASREKSYRKLAREFQDTFKAIIEMIEGMSSNELFLTGQRSWAGEKWPVVKWIQVNTIAPYTSARTKIRRWKKESSL